MCFADFLRSSIAAQIPLLLCKGIPFDVDIQVMNLFRNESYTSYGCICLCILKDVTLNSFVKEDHKVENVATEIAGQNSELD